MMLFIVWTLATSAIVSGEGYDYKEAAAPVIEHGNLNGFQPIAPPGTPCAHSPPHLGAPAALIQAQSLGRILNHSPHQHHHQASVDNNLETAASNTQSQAVTVNSHIVVGEQNVGGKTQTFRPGQGYVQGGPPSLPSPPLLHYQHQHNNNNFNPGLGQQLPPQLPAQQFNPAHLPPGKVVPSQLIGSQGFHGHSFPPPPSAGAAHVHHHYTVPGAQHFGGGHQYASSFGAQSAQSSASLHGVPQPHAPALLPPLASALASFHGPASYQPLVSAPGPIGGFAAPRPVQHFGGGGGGSSANYQNGGGSYAGSYSHSSHGAQHLNTNAFSTFNAAQQGASFNGGSQTSLHFGAGAGSALSGQLGQVIQETFASAPLDPSVEKHIYVHVPPEDLEEHDAKHAIQAALPAKAKKHYKIIFIKAPSAPTPNYAQLAAAAAPQTEEKTLVYVLVKKPDEPSIEELQQLTQSPVKLNKPEVYFIKYKTRKEGEALGAAEYAGVSQYNNGGAGGGSVESAALTNEYLPPSGTSSYSTDGDGAIDIRSGALGESGSTSSSATSYSTSASTSSSSSTSASTSSSGFVGHSAYGVPLN